MRLIMQKAEVITQDGQILQVKCQGRTYPVQDTLRHWKFGGQWWLDGLPREYYLVQTPTGTVLEIFEEVLEWTLSAIQD
ncbi:hypothetical protein [Deinococcus roseus]|uniref:Uncharacterized protein n=1 Tax=Deinococcus roseus TaxID=392414 RepID=A0ABQ2DI91_9DEIO|nr:hypothetical protein [Deinococcus roseus]GGJ59021.1 hypothetical protein GCM10008938_51340 [Deinococcus roseus]